MNKLMLKKAEVARKRFLRPARQAQALSPQSVVDLRVAALSRMRSTSIKPDLTAAAVQSRAADLRKQLHRG
jgi:hypothetical protein